MAVSGVAGPAPQDDQPPGTVWLAVRAGGRTHSTRLEHLAGDRPVVEATMGCAAAWLLALLHDASVTGTVSGPEHARLERVQLAQAGSPPTLTP